jgi:uncharacterized cupin superfamily protein
MNRCELNALPWVGKTSPTGKFRSSCCEVSIALGNKRNLGLWGGGQPFDLQLRRIPPGAAICPFHSHLAQTELFVVRAGQGTVRAGNETHAVKTGDVFVHSPGEPHQLINSGPIELEVLIIADNPQFDAFYYPDSEKWGLRPPDSYFRATTVAYFDGEDILPTSTDVPKPFTPEVTTPALTPFAQRKISIDDLAWETCDSPKKNFRGESKALSEALGAKRNTPTGLGGHPFDLELGRVPPGFSCCPFHSHAMQWECYIFLSGTGTVRTLEGLTAVNAGDVVLHPPGEAHQFANTGNEELLYFLIADNPLLDVWHYPDSNKWGISSPRKIFRATDAPYWDGEE